MPVSATESAQIVSTAYDSVRVRRTGERMERVAEKSMHSFTPCHISTCNFYINHMDDKRGVRPISDCAQ